MKKILPLMVYLFLFLSLKSPITRLPVKNPSVVILNPEISELISLIQYQAC
jgi:hypothetical protein